MTINIGGALLRVLGSDDRKDGEPNPASASDAYSIIDALMDSPELRARCAALSALSKDVPVESRKATCRALLIWMVCKRVPPDGPPMKEDGTPDHDNFLPLKGDGSLDYEKFVNTTQEYAALASPRPGTRWSLHCEAKYKKSGAAEYVRVSPYLAEMITAFESLFGVQGALLHR